MSFNEYYLFSTWHSLKITHFGPKIIHSLIQMDELKKKNCILGFILLKILVHPDLFYQDQFIVHLHRYHILKNLFNLSLVFWYLNACNFYFLYSRLEVTRKGEMYKIVIKNLTRDDAGQYACQVGERPSKCDVIIDECK